MVCIASFFAIYTVVHLLTIISNRVTTGSRITQKGCIFGFHSHVMTCCISDGGVFVEESNYSLLFHAMLHYV